MKTGKQTTHHLLPSHTVLLSIDKSRLCPYSLHLSSIVHCPLSITLILFPSSSSPSYSYLAITSPEDVARVEKQTYVCTMRKEDSVPTPAPGVESVLGNWKDPQEMDKEMDSKFQGSMEGKTPSHLLPSFLSFKM